MLSKKINFTDLVSRSNQVTKSWKTVEPVDEITLSWWGTQELISFAFDFDAVSALPHDDQYAVMLELARRLEVLIDDEEAQD